MRYLTALKITIWWTLSFLSFQTQISRCKKVELRPDIYLARMMSDWNPENWLFVLWIEGVIIESLPIKKSNNEKYDFGKSSIIFIFQDLTAIKEAIAFNCRKLKGTFILQSYYNRNGIINVKREWQKLTNQNLIYKEVIDFDVGEIYLDLS